MDPGAVLLALLGHPNLCSRAWVTTQYDETVGADTVEGGEHGAAVLRVTGTPHGAGDGHRRLCRAWRRWTRTLGAALAVAECTRNVGGHRGPAARRDRLPELRRPRPPGGLLGLHRGHPRRGRRLPRRWSCRSPAATSASTTSRAAGPSRRRPRSAWSACSTTSTDGCGPVFRSAGDVIGLLGSTTPGLAGSVYASLAGASLDDRPPGLELGRERALQERAHRGRGAGPAGVGPGRLAAAASPSPSPRAASGRAWGPSWHLAVGSTPALELFGEAPSRAVVSTTPEALGAPRRRSPPAAACRCERMGRVGGDRLRIRLDRRWPPPARPRSAARASPTTSTCRSRLRHAWTAGLPRAPSARRPEPCAASSASSAPATRRPRSPRSACSRSSTAARSRPAWPSATAMT